MGIIADRGKISGLNLKAEGLQYWTPTPTSIPKPTPKTYGLDVYVDGKFTCDFSGHSAEHDRALIEKTILKALANFPSMKLDTVDVNLFPI